MRFDQKIGFSSRTVLSLTSNHDKRLFIQTTSSLLIPQKLFRGISGLPFPLKVCAIARFCPYFPTPKTWAKSCFRIYHLLRGNGRPEIRRNSFCGVRGDEVVRVKSRLSWFEVRESTVFELKPIFLSNLIF